MEMVEPVASIDEYLESTAYVGSRSDAIIQKAQELCKGLASEPEKVAACFAYVRDDVAHTVDIGESTVIRTAEDALFQEHGTCYTKGMLLVALLRGLEIPAGFCYQRLFENSDDDPHFFLHGLTAYYSADQNSWIRLDPRGGSKDVDAPRVDADLVSRDYLVFRIDESIGEVDYLTVLPRHPDQVLAILEVSSNCIRMIEQDLPTMLDTSA